MPKGFVYFSFYLFESISPLRLCMSDEFVSLLLLLFFFERDESRNGTDDEKRLRSPSVSSFVIRFFFNFVRAFYFSICYEKVSWQTCRSVSCTKCVWACFSLFMLLLMLTLCFIGQRKQRRNKPRDDEVLLLYIYIYLRFS